MNDKELVTTAKAMVADGKGLLAMDESTPTCNKRFAKLGILLPPCAAQVLKFSRNAEAIPAKAARS